ncbi:restriction endonuclease subunit S [Chryseobacterium salipaludis]|uniref:restriction endonuclease subunit S n=1 Tax=Chryseobacterium TaxID=59732 RepID=UPI001FF2CC87|nr:MULTISPECIES: restriction endonuclease subunit S [Chryseobacterium]MCJ8498049.1 restriction endonuclease subunit S [Chryseobacterium salipaludis]MCX3296752.1 restriction endonuclease subunit S [Planobacterium sp. JC490]
MNNWIQISIGEFIDFNPAETIKKGVVARKISMDKLGTFQRKIVGSEYAVYSAGPKFRNDDTVVAKITPCLENGKTALVDVLNEDEVAFGSSEFIVLRENDYSDAKFIYYLARSPIFRDRAISCMEGTSGRKRVNEGALKRQEILVPKSKFDQKKIAAVLSALDDKIELNNQINAELEALAKTLYDYWFVQFDFPDESGKPYKSSGRKMVYHEVLKREIPEGWEVKNIFDVAKVQYGFPFSTQFFNADECGVPVIRIRDILENSISNYSSENNVDEKYLISKGDLLIGMDGNFHINYWSKNGCYLNQRVVMIKEKNIPNMLVRYQIEPYIKLREKSVSRTTVGHLSDKDLKRLNILVPTKTVAEKSKKLFDRFLQKIVTNQNQNQELAQLRDWLLPMLMNGQVTVGEVEEKGMVAEERTKYKSQ